MSATNASDLLEWPEIKAARDAAIQAVAENAGEDFIFKARQFVLTKLREGEASGEQLTEACKAAGIKPHNDKAFGAVYGGLSRDKLIVRSGFCARTKGHGTGGGSIWRLASHE